MLSVRDSQQSSELIRRRIRARVRVRACDDRTESEFLHKVGVYSELLLCVCVPAPVCVCVCVCMCVRVWY